jgi:hypothetical protein
MKVKMVGTVVVARYQPERAHHPINGVSWSFFFLTI